LTDDVEVWEGHGLLRALVLAVLFVFLQILLSGILAVVMVVVGVRLAPGDPAGIALVNVVSAAIVLAVGWRWSGRPFEEVFPLKGFPVAYCVPMVPLVVGLAIVSSECDNVLRYFFPMPEALVELFSNLTSRPFASFFTLVIVAPVTEEYVVRGLMLAGMLRRYSPRKALLWSALIFALLHMNPYQFVPTFLAGLFLGALFIETRSLWACIVGHALFNAHVVAVPQLIPIEIPGFNPDTFDPAVVQFQPMWFNLLGIMLVLLGAFGFRLLGLICADADAETGHVAAAESNHPTQRDPEFGCPPS